MPWRRRPCVDALEPRMCLTATFPIGLTHDIAETTGSERWTTIDVGDVDADGDIDVAASLYDHDQIRLMTNQSDEGWQAESLPGSFDKVHDVAIDDLNGDGTPDLIGAALGTGEIWWYPGSPFGYGDPERIGSELPEIRRVMIHDVDGDQDQDVISIHSDRVHWFENRADTQDFEKHFLVDTYTKSSWTQRIYDIQAGDFNGDERTDLVIGQFPNGAGNTVRVLYGQEDGSFSAPAVIYEPESGVRSLAVGDFDQDTDDDLIVGLENGQLLLYTQTDGLLNFQYEITDEADSPVEIVVADMDDDKDLDLVIAAYGPDEILYVENTGIPETPFKAPTVVRHLREPYGLAAIDMDADDDIDIVAASRNRDGASQIQWYEQRVIGDSNNDGTFNSSDFVAVFRAGQYEDEEEGNSTFETGDWNGDGEFNSRDFVAAFQANTYVAAAKPTFGISNLDMEWRAKEKDVDRLFDATDSDWSPFDYMI